MSNFYCKCTLFLTGLLLPLMTLAQGISVSGKVTEASGESLPGVSVLIKDSSMGTVTDVDGSYSLSVSSGEVTLVFSFVGYANKEVLVGNQTTIDVVLDEQVSQLDELVVVGYGTQEKRDVTGAVSSVEGEAFENLPVIGVSQALQGRAAGVNVVRNGGAPGDGGSIRIRGTGTVNNADPLVIIDGVPAGDINDVNPNDIASVEVLKDASASAIYGTRAANGVIIITTKSGSYEQKMQVKVNGYTGFSNAIKTIDVLEAPQLAELKRERYTNDGLPVEAIWENPEYQTQRTNWQEELLGTGRVNNFDVGVSGGSSNSSFALSASYFDEEGMIKNSYFTRYSFRLNSDHKVGDRFRVSQRLQLTSQRGNSLNTTSAQTGVLWSAIRFHPGLPVQYPDGSYGSSQVSGEFGDINNPIFTVDTEDRENTRHRILGSLSGEYEILDGLKLKANFGLDGVISDNYEFFIIIDEQIRARSRNALVRSYNEFYSILQEYFLSYDKVIGNLHKVGFVGGYTSQTFNNNGFNAERTDFPDESSDQRYLNSGNTITGAGGTRSYDALASWFGRLNYAFDDKYLVTATFRADGSSKFAEENKWGYFPAFSLGWRISEEDFFLNTLSSISNLKLTGGWGQLGNQNVPGLQYLALIQRGDRYSFGINQNQVVGAAQTRIPNPAISWETAEMLNFGLDIGFLDDQFLATFNYFIKDTKDMLLAPPTIGSQGEALVPDQNVGELRNSGLEIDLSYRKLSGPFTFEVSGNVSFIKNEVIKLYDSNFLASQRYGRPNQEIARTYEGQPIATFYGWRADGLYQNQAEIDADPNIANDPRRANEQIQPGDVRFVDLNGDGIIDDEDREILGSPHPAVTYGLNASVGYKNFDLSLFFLGVGGVEIYNADRMQGLDPTYPFNMYQEVENRWHGEGTSNSIPRMTTNRNNLNHRTSDLFIEKGDFFRLKNLTLGYNIPQEVMGFARARVYVTGQNIFTITSYSGMDPELGYIEGSNLQRNVDYAQYPQARTWTLGASITF